jgi:hypothetical protein
MPHPKRHFFAPVRQACPERAHARRNALATILPADMQRIHRESATFTKLPGGGDQLRLIKK